MPHEKQDKSRLPGKVIKHTHSVFQRLLYAGIVFLGGFISGSYIMKQKATKEMKAEAAKIEDVTFALAVDAVAWRAGFTNVCVFERADEEIASKLKFFDPSLLSGDAVSVHNACKK